ncbi:hypothetical protein MPTK1_4g19990 [Marchantia polymorpha subsp. ruderalis]|uniref:Uncharacterized protein n=2 Tax=Marchantia polymorpha TaxID=3197 RepID=A0AAF6BBU0_MARPO|nr:hypothetical protein MARPO_0116s0001 [Marchantia polymorpha]BBN09474.1 hypothetical protein Mp_4g19990 [Marchantia polymorpha subsp. ruderalis]|eukprot:PTQ31010.1 hypothetical protein MARPO_0116s0001 [Marchantia polymorpha]
MVRRDSYSCAAPPSSRTAGLLFTDLTGNEHFYSRYEALDLHIKWSYTSQQFYTRKNLQRKVLRDERGRDRRFESVVDSTTWQGSRKFRFRRCSEEAKSWDPENGKLSPQFSFCTDIAATAKPE